LLVILEIALINCHCIVHWVLSVTYLIWLGIMNFLRIRHHSITTRWSFSTERAWILEVFTCNRVLFLFIHSWSLSMCPSWCLWGFDHSFLVRLTSHIHVLFIDVLRMDHYLLLFIDFSRVMSPVWLEMSRR